MPWIFKKLVDASESQIAKVIKSFWGFILLGVAIGTFVLAPFGDRPLVMTFEIIPLFPADSVSPLPSDESYDLLRIEIHNRSEKPVEGFELHVRGVKDLDRLAMYSNSRRMIESLDIKNLAEFVGQRELYFRDLDVVPPDSSTLVLVWGEVVPPLMGQTVELRPRNAVEDRQSRRISGWPLVLVDNLPIILTALAIFLFYLGLRRMPAEK